MPSGVFFVVIKDLRIAIFWVLRGGWSDSWFGLTFLVVVRFTGTWVLPEQGLGPSGIVVDCDCAAQCVCMSGISIPLFSMGNPLPLCLFYGHAGKV